MSKNALISTLTMMLLLGCEEKHQPNERVCGEFLSWGFTVIRIENGIEQLTTVCFDLTGIDFFLVCQLEKPLEGEILVKDNDFLLSFTIKPNYSLDKKEAYYSFRYVPIRGLDEKDFEAKDLSKIQLYFVNETDTCLIKKHYLYDVCTRDSQNGYECALPEFIDTLALY